MRYGKARHTSIENLIKRSNWTRLLSYAFLAFWEQSKLLLSDGPLSTMRKLLIGLGSFWFGSFFRGLGYLSDTAYQLSYECVPKSNQSTNHGIAQ